MAPTEKNCSMNIVNLDVSSLIQVEISEVHNGLIIATVFVGPCSLALVGRTPE